MKRIMIAMLSLMLTLPMMAQYRRPRYATGRYGYSTYTRTSYRHNPVNSYVGFRVGGAFSTVSSDDKYLDGGTMRTGLNVGVVAGLQVAPHAPIYFETGLSFIEKGGKGNFEGRKFTYNLDYLEVPLLLKYDCKVDRDISIQPFLGGYVAAGVGGKIKDFGHRQAYSSYDDDAFNRFDGGIKLGCGVQFNYLYAEVGYDFGLSNISRDYFDDAHTGSLFATIGVNF